MAGFLSALFWIYVFIISVIIFPFALLVWLITLPFDPRRFVLHKVTCFWASMLTWLNPAWNVDIEDRQNLDPEKSYIIVSNHLSMVDILAIFRLFNHFKFVSKAENFKIPLVGWNMSFNRYIKLKRGSMRSNARMMQDCEAALNTDNSVFIFPEGTRSASGKLMRFQRGAFELAKRTCRPVLPIVLKGSHKALPKKGLVLRGIHNIKIKVLAEITPDSFKDMSADQLMQKVHNIISDEYYDATQNQFQTV